MVILARAVGQSRWPGSIRCVTTRDKVVSRSTMPNGARSSSCSFFSEARGAWQLAITSMRAVGQSGNAGVDVVSQNEAAD